MAKNTKPAIRFKGFTDDWEQRKLGEVATEMIAGGDVDKELLLEEGHYPVIANALTNDGIVGYYNDQYRIKAPAVTVTGRGDVGHAKARNVDFTPVVRLLSIKTNHDVYFLENAINTLKIVIESTGVPQLTVPQLAKYEISFPKALKEEEKIGQYFANLDHLITLHQRKYDSLVNVKKAMLEKMFPKNGETVPEIRFKGFTDAWEQRKLGEIAPLRGGYAFQSNNFLEEGIPIVKISNILSTGEVAGEFSFYEELDNDTNFILPDKAAVLAMSGATTGKVSILSNPSNIKFYQNQRVGYFKKTDGINYPFISTLVRSQVFNNQLNSILVTGAQPNVSSKDIDDFDVLIPASYKEQKKIGAYFSNLDHLITLHQRKLEKLKNIKKSCLEKMFV